MIEKKTLKERRIDSDKRIIDAAIRSFGQVGYTYSSIRDIAKAAGITSGLITQRYGTKESLFLTAYLEVMKHVYSDVETTASPRECLYTIIHDIENLSENNPDAFAFCYMLHNATDYPKEILRPQQGQMKQGHVYSILKNAQDQGMLPTGDLDVLLAAFGSMVYHNVNLCKRYHLEYSNPDVFLKGIRFNDAIYAREENWHRILETAIANTFDLLTYVNITENNIQILNSSEDFAVFVDSSDARQDIENSICSLFPEEEQQKMRDYLNIDTLGERLKGRKSLSTKSKQLDGSMLVHTFLPLTWDENGNLTEVFSGIYTVQTNGVQE